MQDVEWNLRLPRSGRVVSVGKDEEPEGEGSERGESDTGEEAREGEGGEAREGTAGEGAGASVGVKVGGAEDRWWEDEEEWGVCVCMCVIYIFTSDICISDRYVRVSIYIKYVLNIIHILNIMYIPIHIYRPWRGGTHRGMFADGTVHRGHV
jgi:hypothetical protein